jgi:hypothetical protein
MMDGRGGGQARGTRPPWRENTTSVAKNSSRALSVEITDDIKNAFFHGKLQEEVYMEIPPGFSGSETEGKVCRLNKALYGLKQSPRAWFGRFRKEVCSLEFQQRNANHTLFFKHHQTKIVILVVYVDDIVVTGNDDEEIRSLKKMLAKSLEVKDLGFLH